MPSDIELELIVWSVQAAYCVTTYAILAMLTICIANEEVQDLLALLQAAALQSLPVVLTLYDRSGFLAQETGTRLLEEIALWWLRNHMLAFPLTAFVGPLADCAVLHVVAFALNVPVRVRGVWNEGRDRSIRMGQDGRFWSLNCLMPWQNRGQNFRKAVGELTQGGDPEKFVGALIISRK